MIQIYPDEEGNVRYSITCHINSGENQQEFVKTGTVYSTKENPYKRLFPAIIQSMKELSYDLDNVVKHGEMCIIEWPTGQWGESMPRALAKPLADYFSIWAGRIKQKTGSK